MVIFEGQNEGEFATIMNMIGAGIAEIEKIVENQIGQRRIDMPAGRGDPVNVQLKVQQNKDREKGKTIIKLLNNLGEAFKGLGLFGTKKLIDFYRLDLLEVKKAMAEEAYHEKLFNVAQDTATRVR